MDVRSVQDSGTMPLITEVILAVSVGCVEIRNTAANQEEDDMDSYQVAHQRRFSEASEEAAGTVDPLTDGLT